MKSNNEVIKRLICAWVGALLLPLGAVAEQKPRPLWEMGAGVAGLSFPDYRGSDEQRSYRLPIPYFVYRGEILKVDRESARALLLKQERIDIDLSANGSVPVRSSQNSARHGMPDIDPTLELGPQFNLRLAEATHYKLTFHLPVRSVQAFDGGFHDVGWLASPVLNLDLRSSGLDERWNLGISGGPYWADKRYHNLFYGVATAYATADRPAYDAEGGYGGVQFTLALSRRYPQSWVGAFVRMNDVRNAVFEESPLVKRKTNYMVGFGITRLFARSDKLVVTDQ